MSDQPEDGDEPPWERPGVLKRDCEPHRGGLLRLLGVVSLLIGLISLFLVLSAFTGLFLGAVITIVVRRDLAEIREGIRDLAGEADTRYGCGLAGGGVVLNGVAW